MDCPRCGISVLAELNTCRTCGWQLWKPYQPEPSMGSRSGNGRSEGSGLGRSKDSPIQTAADAFALSPPARVKPPALPRRLSRRRKGAPASEAVATLPPEARWEASPRFEVIEPPRVQSAFDFQAAEREFERLAAQAAAPLGLRFQAALLDSVLLVLASAVFFGLFALLSGQESLARRDLLIYLVAGFVLTALYFGLFTLFGGRTPGMQYYGLRVVGFDGKPLTPGRALRRAFGYVVSVGSLLLGFFWAVVDERRLTWHDHISETFLTHRTDLPS